MLDLDTLIVAALAPALISTVIFAAMRRGFPAEIRGLTYFTWSAALFTLTLTVYAFQTLGRMEYLVVSRQTFLFCAFLTMYLGIRELAGKPDKQRLMPLILLGLAVPYLSWFTFFDYSLVARTTLTSGFYSLVLLSCGYFMYSMRPRTLGTLLTTAALLAAALISILRFATLLGARDAHQFMLGPLPLQKLYMGMLPVALQVFSVGIIVTFNERLRERLSFLASHDPLTSVLSRSAFFSLLERELESGRRHELPTTVAMIDLDHFKQLNERFGHRIGDRVLADLARRATALLRRQDAIGRHGSGEFALVFPDTPLAEALLAAEQIRSAIAAADNKELPAYTVSIGVALARSATGANPEMALHAAETALSHAKQNGRNRVEYATGQEAAGC